MCGDDMSPHSDMSVPRNMCSGPDKRSAKGAEIETLKVSRRRVLEYSLRYSPSTRVANYSDSTALVHRHRTHDVVYIYGRVERMTKKEGNKGD